MFPSEFQVIYVKITFFIFHMLILFFIIISVKHLMYFLISTNIHYSF